MPARAFGTTFAVLAGIVSAAVLVGGGSRAAAHTETDLVAVPAGSDATVALRPTHGCGDSPTVTVRIRAPFEDVEAEPVAGWQEAATSDGAGNTVLEWSGGVLPADAAGSFPLHFTVPDEPGRLLVFPAVQRCEDGEELAWINGDPTAEYPAPRLLVLPAGSAPAATIDEVPPDAPGRDQLVAVVDVDGPGAAGATSTTVAAAPTTTARAPTIDVATSVAATSTTTSARTTTVQASAAATTTSEPTSDDDVDAGGDDGDDEDGEGGGFLAVVLGAAVAAAAAVAIVAARRRRA
jgi:uncharacterized protein YcnI